MKAKALRPEDLAKRGIALLEKKANPQKAVEAQRYFKETFRSYGMSADTIREIAGALYENVKNVWTVEDAMKLCEISLPHPYHETKCLAILILHRYKKDYRIGLFENIKKWLSANYLDNWAAVDVLCPEAMGTLIEKYPELVGKIKDWAFSPNKWVRRASAVSFIKLAKKEKYLDPIYEISVSLFPDKDDLIQKANGWLLREAGKTDMSRLESFLLENGPQIPRTSLRYAIERFDPRKRKELLSKTRS